MATAIKIENEQEVIRRAQQGDQDAFAQLYGAYRAKVHQICLYKTKDETLAEDLEQEVFLQLFRKIGTFRGESALGTWLHRMAVNIVLMQFRRKGLPTVSLEHERENRRWGGGDWRSGRIDHAWGRILGNEPPVVDKCPRFTDYKQEIERAIMALAPGYRAVFVLHDVEGYEYPEVAAKLGITVGAVKSQLHKARLKMRQFLQDPASLQMAESHPRSSHGGPPRKSVTAGR